MIQTRWHSLRTVQNGDKKNSFSLVTCKCHCRQALSRKLALRRAGNLPGPMEVFRPRGRRFRFRLPQGLGPKKCRTCITKPGFVILMSEVGVSWDAQLAQTPRVSYKVDETWTCTFRLPKSRKRTSKLNKVSVEKSTIAYLFVSRRRAAFYRYIVCTHF